MSATSGRQDGGPMAHASSGMQGDAGIAGAYGRVRDGSLDWLTLHLANNKTPTLDKTGKGKSDLLAAVEADRITFGAVRVASANAIRGFVVVGDSASGMARAKQMMHKNAVMNLFEGKHGEISAEGLHAWRDELDKVWK
ncbi:unnamed protein product [Amoebophrya sp. A25]|nr:unnamed protein product [Amoebophrya sp. A25]|eukprot:GSA25T00001299001.1